MQQNKVRFLHRAAIITMSDSRDLSFLVYKYALLNVMQTKN